jgi:hypothetical protein
MIRKKILSRLKVRKDVVLDIMNDKAKLYCYG